MATKCLVIGYWLLIIHVVVFMLIVCTAFLPIYILRYGVFLVPFVRYCSVMGVF